MQNLQEKRSISRPCGGGAMLLVLKMSRVAGVAPLSFGPDGIRFSRPYFIYSLILIAVLNTIILTGFSIDMSDPQRSVRASSLTAAVCWAGSLAVTTAVALLGCLGAPARCRCLVDALHRIHEIRTRVDVGNNKEQLPEKLLYAIVCLFATAFGILCVTDLAFYANNAIKMDKNVHTIFLFSLFYFNYCIEFLLELQFLWIVLSLQLAARDINTTLSGLLLTLEKEEYFHRNACNTVRRLVSGHEAVCSVLRGVARRHGAMLLVLLQSFFLHSVITPYNMITLYSASGDASSLAIQAAWLGVHACDVALVVEPCHLMQLEMDRTRELVSQALRQSNAALRRELRVFYTALMLDRPVVAPLGMCVLGRPLVVAMLGAVTTYLVIILQFRANDEQMNQ